MTLREVVARRPRLVIAAIAVLALAAVVAIPYFAPKPSTLVDQGLPMGMEEAQFTEAARGAFRDGAPGHHAEGTARVLQGPEGWYLRLEGYEATAGPDVYFFLSPVAEPRSTEDVESGVRVLVPGGSDEGEATLRGNFNVPLPQGFDPARHRSLVAWCDNFNVLFGVAPLA
jgi:hypothetical protein